VQSADIRTSHEQLRLAFYRCVSFVNSQHHNPAVGHSLADGVYANRKRKTMCSKIKLVKTPVSNANTPSVEATPSPAPSYASRPRSRAARARAGLAQTVPTEPHTHTRAGRSHIPEPPQREAHPVRGDTHCAPPSAFIGLTLTLNF